MSKPDVAFAYAPCHRPLIRMLIQHYGEMCHCCEDNYGVFKLGNVHKQSLEELWFSERHLQIITELIAGQRQNYALCQNCPLPPTGPALVGRKIEIMPRRYDGISKS